MVEFSFKDRKSINASLESVWLWGTILIDILECGYFEVQPTWLMWARGKWDEIRWSRCLACVSSVLADQHSGPCLGREWGWGGGSLNLSKVNGCFCFPAKVTARELIRVDNLSSVCLCLYLFCSKNSGWRKSVCCSFLTTHSMLLPTPANFCLESLKGFS